VSATSPISTAPQTAPEIHAFLLWSNALPKAPKILADLRSRFTIVAVFEIEWSRGFFAGNLTRFYGQTMEPGSPKELHCGGDPFLLVVVHDLSPTYAVRRTTRGEATLNVRTFDAKRRYRRWTGGGHRIHATVSRREADKDLFLLLGRRAESFAAALEWDGSVLHEQRDLLGADGWDTRAQLLTALEVVTGYVDLDGCAAASAALDRGAALRLLVDNQWWAARIANGAGASDGLQEVRVAGEELPLALSEVGDLALDASWQHALLSNAVRDSRGLLVPSPVDRYHLTLHDVATVGRALSAAEVAELDRLADAHALPHGDYRDRAFAATTRDAYVARLAPPAIPTSATRRGRSSLGHVSRLVRRLAPRPAR
jgi:hypothetical protein